MPDYAFFVRYVRFVAAKTARESEEVERLVGELERLADDIEQDGKCLIEQGRAALSARALAGFAGFLQQQILPETVEAGHDKVEREIRWIIDASMAEVSGLTVFADTAAANETYTLTLPSL
jgi:hypothetical protein